MQKGFTLIETIIYLALFSIIIGGVLVSAYQIIQASTQSQENALIQEEGHFLVAKINWALTGARTVTFPASGTPGTTLDLDKFDGTSVIIDWFNPDMRSQPGNTPLNSASVRVDPIPPSTNIFTYIDPVGSKPAAVKVDFRVTSTLTGQYQDFSTTKFLRK